MVSCCFAGHRMASESLKKEVVPAVERIIQSSPDDIVFYSGGMGDFDRICEQAVREIKQKYNDKNIKLCKVLPSYSYVNDNIEESYLNKLFDEIFVCNTSDGTHYKSMIGKRNRWLVEHSDYIIAYVVHKSGGAYNTLCYAEKKGMNIIRVGL